MQVLAVYGSWHLGQLQVGLSGAVRLAQCRSLQLNLQAGIPMQIDGEPWFQAPAKVDISLRGKVGAVADALRSRLQPDSWLLSAPQGPAPRLGGLSSCCRCCAGLHAQAPGERARGTRGARRGGHAGQGGAERHHLARPGAPHVLLPGADGWWLARAELPSVRSGTNSRPSWRPPSIPCCEPPLPEDWGPPRGISHLTRGPRLYTSASSA